MTFLLRSAFLSAFLLVTGPVAQDPADLTNAVRLFEEGNASYLAGDFEKARAAYEDVRRMGYESAALYHNLGNAYFRMDRLGYAMLNYQRASRLLPSDPGIEHNIRLLQTRSQDRFSQVPTPVLTKWWNSFMEGVGTRRLFWLGAIAWLLGLGLASYRLWAGATAPWLRRLAASLVAVGVFSAGCSLATSAARASFVRGVVLSDRAEVREEPSNGARSTVAIHEALVVDVLRRAEGWTEIRLPNGITGFVRSEALQTV